jgi:hypothetical protein
MPEIGTFGSMPHRLTEIDFVHLIEPQLRRHRRLLFPVWPYIDALGAARVHCLTSTLGHWATPKISMPRAQM